MKFWITAITGMLLFAAATAVLYGIGLKKAMRQEQTLSELLMNKGAQRVVSYLKRNGSVTQKKVEELVDGIKTSVFYSRQGAVVSNRKEFAAELIRNMLEKQMIEKDQTVYRLKKRK